MAAAEKGRLYYAVLSLRLLWLVPLTLVAAGYAALTAFNAARMLRAPWAIPFVEVAIAGLLCALVWRSWKKTAQLYRGEITPLPEAVWWQLLWVLLVLAVPALVIAPKIVDLQRYVVDGRNLGGLARARSAVESFFKASGSYPATAAELSGALEGGMPELWAAKYSGSPHKPTSEVLEMSEAKALDSGKWAFVVSAGTAAPAVFIDCTHLRSGSVPWSAY